MAATNTRIGKIRTNLGDALRAYSFADWASTSGHEQWERDGANRSVPRTGSALPLRLFVSVAFLIAASAGGAKAAGEPVYDTKVYFSGTKSYYEMIPAMPGDSIRGDVREIGWTRAETKARQRIYKGVNGRLAVVRSPALHNWLLQTFRPDGLTWIGLRYWCQFNRLQWVDGSFHKRTAWAAWDVHWAKQGGTRTNPPKKPACSQSTPFWPVHYWPSREGFYWNANGNKKEGKAFFVEYRTGRE